MPKFKVEIFKETQSYCTYTVEAENKDIAGAKAYNNFLNGESPEESENNSRPPRIISVLEI